MKQRVRTGGGGAVTFKCGPPVNNANTPCIQLPDLSAPLSSPQVNFLALAFRRLPRRPRLDPPLRVKLMILHPLLRMMLPVLMSSVDML